MRRRNVEKTQLVRPRRIIGLRLLHRIARIAQVDEVDALDYAALRHVEAGYDTHADGHVWAGRVTVTVVVLSPPPNAGNSPAIINGPTRPKPAANAPGAGLP